MAPYYHSSFDEADPSGIDKVERTPMPSFTIKLRLPSALKASLDQIAHEKDTSASAMLRKIIDSYCRRETPLPSGSSDQKASIGFMNRMTDSDLAFTYHHDS